jgi:hypothetical protein
MTAFNLEQEDFWHKNGYIVVPDAVPQSLLKAVVGSIERFLGKDLSDPADWYKEPMYPGGIINMNQHQSMWETRQHPRLHQAFAQIWGTEKLRVSVDRTNMNPPSGTQWDQEGTIHWDMDSTVKPVPFKVQGVLCLSDTAADQGGFCCVPGFHRTLEEWSQNQPPDRPPTTPDTTGMDIRHIAAKAGDLIIWHSALPHGNSRNRTQQPRLCQYITMSPAPGQVSDTVPLARTRRAVLADALGVPEGLVEKWLRDQREAERVIVKADRVADYAPVPRLIRLEKDGRVQYLNRDWGRIIDAETVEARRDHAERLGLPIIAATAESAEEVRQARRQIPQPRFEPRLQAAQLAQLPDLFEQGPRIEQTPLIEQAPQGTAQLWDEDSATQVLVQKFGLALDTREAELTSLGRRLTGVDTWDD